MHGVRIHDPRHNLLVGVHVRRRHIALGGSLFRHEATGAGVVMVVERCCAKLEIPLAGQRCVVQGFGNVGGIAAGELHEKGAVVVGVSDLSGGLHDESGLDIPALRAYAEANGSLAGYERCERVTNEELLELPCDILVLGAREDQVTGENAGRVQARIVAEGANGPTSVEADVILGERGILVLPDVLTNAGGVTVSYFEWVQDRGGYFWSEESVNDRLRDIMTRSFKDVLNLSRQHKVNMRTAAYMLAITRVSTVHKLRGIYA